MVVCVTIDMEQDCPPYLHTWRGVEQGAPILFDLLRDEGIPATFFVTGDLARRYPEVVRRIVAAGHEVGCHGDTHRRFDRMDAQAAEAEIAAATETLRGFCPVTSFRAPNLKLPTAYLAILERHAYRLDSSVGRHKALGVDVCRVGAITRVPVSVTSSTLRWPARLRDPLLGILREPVVLFVHPWEFVDLAGEPLRIDLRFRTGAVARRCLKETIHFYKGRGASFVRMRDLKL